MHCSFVQALLSSLIAKERWRISQTLPLTQTQVVGVNLTLPNLFNSEPLSFHLSVCLSLSLCLSPFFPNKTRQIVDAVTTTVSCNVRPKATEGPLVLFQAFFSPFSFLYSCRVKDLSPPPTAVL